MKYRELELQILDLYRNMGYEVLAGTSLHRVKLDLLITRDMPGLGAMSYAVEYKLQKKLKTGGRSIRELFRKIQPLIRKKVIKGGIIITNTDFTMEAKRMAKSAAIACFTVSELTQQAIKVRPYLESMIRSFEKSVPQHQYMDLRAHPWAKSARSRAKNVPIINTLTKWLELKEQNIMFLLGGYGSGKSTVCRKLFYDVARKNLDKHGERIPILLTERALEESPSLYEAMIKSITISGAPLISSSLFEVMNLRGNLLLFVEDLDDI